MEQVTVSSKDQIAMDEETELTLEVRDQANALSKDPAWKKLAGAGSGCNLMAAFAADKKTERNQ